MIQQQHNRIQNHFEQRETTIKKTETLTIEDKKAIFILGGTMWHYVFHRENNPDHVIINELDFERKPKMIVKLLWI